MGIPFLLLLKTMMLKKARLEGLIDKQNLISFLQIHSKQGRH